MDKKQISKIEEMLMIIPTKMCRNMDQHFVNVTLKNIPVKIAKHHFMILKMLQKKDRFYVTEIVHILGITKSQMTASVDKLIKLRFVKRQTDDKDRRKNYISLTNEGLEITKKVTTEIKERFHENIEKLSEQDIIDLEKGLKVLTKFCIQNEQ